MLVVEGLTCRFGTKAAVDNASFAIEPGGFVGVIGRVSQIPAGRSLAQLWPEADLAVEMSALEQFDMASLAAQRADQLSGGQQQRVAIARALVQEPDIILADEPIASLDPRNTKIVMDALLRINKHFGITVICNLHSLDLAPAYCDRLIG